VIAANELSTPSPIRVVPPYAVTEASERFAHGRGVSAETKQVTPPHAVPLRGNVHLMANGLDKGEECAADGRADHRAQR
jgi:hypothetical protein